MKARYKINRSVYSKRSEMLDTMHRFLVPQKDFIDKLSGCECGPDNAHTQEAYTKQEKATFAERISLETINDQKKIELLDFYNKKISQIRFTRSSILK